MKKSLVLLLLVFGLTVVVFSLLHPIPQSESYHQFADQRSWMVIPNAWDVLSNIAIGLPGVWGLYLLFSPNRVQFNDYRERWLWIGISMGLILIAIGSGYYHLDPNNSNLIWDRLPMTFVFMSIVAALISERINMRLGLLLWPILIGVGFYSVLLWYTSELKGASDLRFYIGVQAFTILATMAMMLTPSLYDRNWELAIVVLCYGLALLFDLFDHQIYDALNGVISGHSLKHLAVGLAGAALIRMICKRKREERI